MKSICFAAFAIFAGLGSTQAIAADLTSSVSSTTLGTVLTGSTVRRRFTLSNIGDSNATFLEGEVVFLTDLTPANDYNFQGVSGGGAVSGTYDCEVISDQLVCTAGIGGFVMGDGSNSTFGMEETFNVPGSISIPAAGGICTIDPNDLITEDDETNNDCGPDTIIVRDPPAKLNDEWLMVSMFEPLTRQYRASTDTHANAWMVTETDGTDVHAVNDIELHPDGNHYVFHRRFQSTSHRLGTFDPVLGITDIADTGNSFHDSAAADDGTLYAVGRNGTLYTVDTVTAVPTARCDTGLGMGNRHTALVWDGNTSDLLQIGDDSIIVIDIDAFPSNSADPCVNTSTTPLDPRVSDDIFAATFVDGNLYLADSGFDLYYFERDGVTLDLADMRISANGMVADPGGVPAPAVTCPIDAYTAAGGTARLLFGVDTSDASLTFLSDLPETMRSLAYNRSDGALYGIANQTLYQFDACTGAITSVLPLISELEFPSFRASSITQQGDGFLFETIDDTLNNFNPGTGAVSIIDSAPRDHVALVIDGEVAITDLTTDHLTTALRGYDLPGFPASFTDFPLSYGPGLEVGEYRQIADLDANPGASNLYGVLRRIDLDGHSNNSSARSSQLVMIDNAQNVSAVGTLPTSAVGLALGADQLLVSGYEEAPEPPNNRTIEIDGRFDFIPETEEFSTTSPGTTAYMTWDLNYFYFGLEGPDIGFASDKWIVVYFGGPGGTTDGLIYNTQQPALPFLARYLLQVRPTAFDAAGFEWTGNWDPTGWDLLGDRATGGTYFEMRIRRSLLGDPETLPVVISIVNEENLNESTFAGVPDNTFVDGYDPDFSTYFEFDFSSSMAPNEYTPQ